MRNSWKYGIMNTVANTIILHMRVLSEAAVANRSQTNRPALL